VYRKLGVRSRTQLSSKLLAGDALGGASTRFSADSMTIVDA
jgi:hypothetical protein